MNSLEEHLQLIIKSGYKSSQFAVNAKKIKTAEIEKAFEEAFDEAVINLKKRIRPIIAEAVQVANIEIPAPIVILNPDNWDPVAPKDSEEAAKWLDDLPPNPYDKEIKEE